MARIRSVKPEICESETMARLTAEQERTFVRLWTHCDDAGRCRDDARLIVAALFPLHDDVTGEVIEAHLTALEAEGLIVRYSVDGKRFLACTSWSEHQHPQKPRPSKIPAPSEADTSADLPKQDESGTGTRHVRDAYGPVVGEGEVVGGVVIPPSPNDAPGLALVAVPDAQPPVAPSAYDSRFEQFWDLCPRKVGKGAAAKAFAKAARTPAQANRIIVAMGAHAAAWERWPASDRQFIPHPSTWLNESRFDDPPPPLRASVATKADRNQQTIAASVARMTQEAP